MHSLVDRFVPNTLDCVACAWQIFGFFFDVRVDHIGVEFFTDGAVEGEAAAVEEADLPADADAEHVFEGVHLKVAVVAFKTY